MALMVASYMSKPDPLTYKLQAPDKKAYQTKKTKQNQSRLRTHPVDKGIETKVDPLPMSMKCVSVLYKTWTTHAPIILQQM